MAAKDFEYLKRRANSHLRLTQSFSSIRGRFLFAASMLVAIVFLATSFAHNQNSQVAQQTTENIHSRYPLLEQSRIIRDSVWRTRESLSAFLSDPAREDLKQVHLNSIEETLIRIEVLSRQTWIHANNHGSLIAPLNKSIQELQHISAEIIEASASPDKQHPSLLLKTKFTLQINRIWQHLIEFDEAVESSSEADVEKMQKLATFETRLLWALTTSVTIIIVVIFFMLDRILLRPLNSLTQAIKSEAVGDHLAPIPRSNLVEIQHLLETFSEMRNQIQQRQSALEFLATHDALTGLPNRRLLSDRLEQAIKKCHRHNTSMAFLLIDMDRFKDINDALGHRTGDHMLQAVAKKLTTVLAGVDTVARLGGDEFGILLEDTDQLKAAKISEKIIKSFEKPIAVDTHLLYLLGSIGIAIYPSHGDTADALIQRADIAMYEAKNKQTGYAIYDDKFDTNNVGRLALMSDLRVSIAMNKLSLYYQPKIDISQNRVIGAEALIRWIHPERGMIPPDQFILAAEHSGLIKPLTLWVLNAAIKQAKEWALTGIELNIAVNVSAYNLQDPEFESEVKGRLSYYNLPPPLLTLEVTESAMMSNPTQAIKVLNHFDQLGIRIAIDDFGTGFSSLSYLKQLPVDELKIDKSFVFGMSKNENESVIVRSTIDLAHNLGLKVVAEGIEDDQVLQILTQWQCDVGQGYYFSRPMPAKDFEIWLRNATFTHRKAS